MLILPRRSALPVAYVFLACFLASSLPGQDTDAEAVWHFQAAKQAQNEGSLDVAAQEYLRVIQLRPDAAEAYASLGLIYHQQGRFAESAQALAKAEKLKPRLPGVSLYLGIDYTRERQAASAIPFLREAVSLEPTNKEALVWLGRALWDDGQIPAALDQFRKTSQLFPSDPVLLLDLGQAYRKAADRGIARIIEAIHDQPLVHQIYGDIYKHERAWQKASAHYNRAIYQDHHWAGAHFGLGEVALRQESLDYEKWLDFAEQEYRQELQLNPRSAAALARLAEIALLREKVDEALALFSSAIRLAPEEASNAVGLPHSYPAGAEDFSPHAQEQLSKCLPLLESAPASPSRSLSLALVNARLGNDGASASASKEFARNTKPSSSSDSYKSGVIHFNRQDFAAAEKDLRAWLKLHPEDLQAAYLLDRTYVDLSLSTLEQLLALAPDSYPAHQLLAEAYENSGEDDKALSEYETVEKIAPNLPGVHFWVGNLLLKMGQRDQAALEMEAELRLNPGHAEANAQMGSILLAQSEQTDAIPYLQKAIELDPDLPDTYLQLGTAYYLQKDYAKAELALEHALRSDPEGTAHYQLGLVYRAMGRTEEADAQFQVSRKIKLERLANAETDLSRKFELIQPKSATTP
jgi:tetratricopeptide (TPR) repeat protein